MNDEFLQHLINTYKNNPSDWHPGEVIITNARTRTALVYDEIKNEVIEAVAGSLSSFQDEDVQMCSNEDLPKEGSKVKISYQDGMPCIVGGLSRLAEPRNKDEMSIRRKVTGVNIGDPLLEGLVTSALSVKDGYKDTKDDTFGSHDPVYKKEVGSYSNYAGNSFEDLMPGDKCISTKDGNLIGVLEGGVNYFKASELCQLIGIRYNNLMRMISSNYQHMTDFGNITIDNNNGSTSYVIEGASSFKSADAGKYNLRIAMGAEGDVYKCTVLQSSSGREISQFHMTASGDIKMFAANKLEWRVLGDKKEVITGGETKFTNGNVKYEYSNIYEEKIGKSFTSRVGDFSNITIGGNEIVKVMKDSEKAILGAKKEMIGGSIVPFPASSQDIGFGDKRERILAAGYFDRIVGAAGGFNRSVVGAGQFHDLIGAGGTMKREIVGAGTIADSVGGLGTISREVVGAGEIKDSVTGGTVSSSLSPAGITHTINSPGGNYTVAVSAGNVNIQAGSLIMSLDLASQTIKLVGVKVDIGAVAAQSVVLGELFQAYFDTHSHPTGVGPSGPPLLPMSANPALLSKTVKVQL